MKRGLMRYLWQGPDGAGCEPGVVQRFLGKVFEWVQVGYLPGLGQHQVACFDEAGACRLVVRYRFGTRTGLWYYEVEPGYRYREPEASTQ